jgi:hypothetical protein
MQAKSALLILLVVRTTHSQQDSLPPLILPEPPKAPATPDPRDAFIQAINNNVIAPQQQPPAADPAAGQGFGNFDREPQFSPPTEAPFTTPSNRFPVQDNRAVFEPPRQDRRPQRPLVDEFGNPLGDVHSGDFRISKIYSGSGQNYYRVCKNVKMPGRIRFQKLSRIRPGRKVPDPIISGCQRLSIL